MPETPPPMTSSPTASEEEEIDQAASPAQDSAEQRRTPPRAAAGTDSNGLPTGSRLGTMEELKEFMGLSTQPASDAQRPPAADSGRTANDRQAASSTSPNPASNAEKGTDKPQETHSEHQQAQPTDSDAPPKEATQPATTQPLAASQPASTQGQGNIQQASQPTPRPLEEYRPVIRTARGADGRFGSPRDPPTKSEAPANRTLSYPSEKLDIPKTSVDSDLERKGGISGLDAIPKGWPDLPSSATLSSEIAWVQANRLQIVKDKPSGGFKVDLAKARSPAPSWSAISWLDTAIRNPSKFAELVAKTAVQANDEAEFVRRERMQLAEIRSILEEMKDAGK